MKTINGSEITLSEKEKELLRNFFDDNYEFITSNDMNDPYYIGLLIEIYKEFLEDNNMLYNQNLLQFHDELSFSKFMCSEFYYNENAEVISDSNVIDISKYFHSISEYECKNETIVKWRNESFNSKIIELDVNSNDEIILTDDEKKLLNEFFEENNDFLSDEYLKDRDNIMKLSFKYLSFLYDNNEGSNLNLRHFFDELSVLLDFFFRLYDGLTVEEANKEMGTNFDENICYDLVEKWRNKCLDTKIRNRKEIINH